MNPNSADYLSFDTGYPNAYDRAHGRTGAASALRLKLFTEVILDGGRESRRFEFGPFIPIPRFDACEDGQFRFDGPSKG
jgi:hypothetical protein